MKQVIVYYHGLCPDGFGAAFIAWLVFGESADYIPCFYGKEPPGDVTGKRVYILDFSFDLATMERLDSQALELVMLDHHITAKHALREFKCKCGSIKFDLNRSGAMLAWNHFFPHKAVPRLITHIQDRDLWRWEVTGSAAYLEALDAIGYDFQKWKEVLDYTEEEAQKFEARGQVMRERFQALCDSIANTAIPVTLFGHEGLMTNSSSEFNSDVGAILARRSGTFGMNWKLLTPSTIKVSLRSVPDFDVEALALRMGGGGHKNASSFNLPLEHLCALISGELRPVVEKPAVKRST